MCAYNVICKYSWKSYLCVSVRCVWGCLGTSKWICLQNTLKDESCTLAYSKRIDQHVCCSSSCLKTRAKPVPLHPSCCHTVALAQAPKALLRSWPCDTSETWGNDFFCHCRNMVLLDGWNSINNGINHLSTGAGFPPSTVWHGVWSSHRH